MIQIDDFFVELGFIFNCDSRKRLEGGDISGSRNCSFFWSGLFLANSMLFFIHFENDMSSVIVDICFFGCFFNSVLVRQSIGDELFSLFLRNFRILRSWRSYYGFFDLLSMTFIASTAYFGKFDGKLGRLVLLLLNLHCFVREINVFFCLFKAVLVDKWICFCFIWRF